MKIIRPVFERFEFQSIFAFNWNIGFDWNTVGEIIVARSRIVMAGSIAYLCFLAPANAFDRQAHTMERAGNPNKIACWAIPFPNHRYIGYYVGGGVACGGEPRLPDDGTWGVDYQGRILPRKVIQNFSHGRLYQGGTGSYKTDGPRLKPIGHLRNF